VYHAVSTYVHDFPPSIAHTLLAELLVLFVALHVLAALYHQFVKRDGLLGRISFGHRLSDSQSSEG
jgi:cytochrome b561